MRLFNRETTPTTSGAGSLTLVGAGLDETMTRYEGFVESVRPTDPYAAWLAQREAERERQDAETTRWVYRPRAAGAAVVPS